MNRYLKLVNFEFNRFIKLYLVLFGATILLQIIGVVYEAKKYVNEAQRQIYDELIPKSDFISSFGKISMMNITSSFWFMAPIAISGITLIIYVFFIWYRDWVGKNTFSYRLLMLPTSRMNIYLSKATTIILMVLGLIALQLLLLPLESQVLKSIVPNEFRMDLTVKEITNQYYLSVLFPKTFLEFILFYGAGMTAVFVTFNAILFERSYRIKGIVFGALYVGASFLFFLSPLLVDTFLLRGFLYPLELFFLEIVAGIIVLVAAIII